MNDLTLHEAIATVLRRNGVAMRSSDIATAVNQGGLFQRKDMKPVQAAQVCARVNKNPHMFERVDGLLALRGRDYGKSEEDKALSAPQSTTEKSGSEALAPLGEYEFECLGKLDDLCQSGIPNWQWLGNCGVYAIVTPADYKPTFSSHEKSEAAGNVIRPWPQPKLQTKWVTGTRVIYIGLAGRHRQRKLRTRIGELLRHACGSITSSGPHKGGEIIWQLDDWGRFELFAMPTDDPPWPRRTEQTLIEAFSKRHEKLPFGNRQK